MADAGFTWDAAIALATRAHAGQVDQAGRPYINHPIRVMGRLSESDTSGRMAAVLHDVLEDTDVTVAELEEAGCPTEVVAAVLSLTKRSGEPYEEFLQRVCENPIARRVKLADIDDNLDETRLALLPPETADRLRRKYVAARSIVVASNDRAAGL